jgi:hypothetical protein
MKLRAEAQKTTTEWKIGAGADNRVGFQKHVEGDAQDDR